MATSKTQDEKHQKLLRALLQEPDNKKCFDCQNKGPVYVCLNFNTFVCTTCSGIHREFNHRVKSISMATFKPEEIKALQAGGNAVARKQWLATWTPNDFPEPDSSDQARIRQFMKLKYHDKRWAAANSYPSSEPTRERSNSRESRQSFNAPPPSRVETVPQMKPLEQILGENIPPIQFHAPPPSNAKPSPHHSGGGVPPPVQAPGGTPKADELVAWNTPQKPSGSAASELNELFNVTPEQQQQYQQQQLQYQQQQQQQQYQQQQQRIMATFNQMPNPNTGMFGQQPGWNGQGFNPNQNPGMFGQQPGWGGGAPPQQGFNPNAFVPQQPGPGASFFTPPPAQPQQPFGAAQGPFGGPQHPFGGGAPPQIPFGQPLQPQASPQVPFGQPYPASASPTFGAPAGGQHQQGPFPGQQPPFGTSPGTQPNFGAPPVQQQPAPPAKPDIFASLSPLNSGIKFGPPSTSSGPSKSTSSLGSGSSVSNSLGSGSGINVSPIHSANGASPLQPNGVNGNPFGGAPVPQTQAPKPAAQQDLFGGGDLFGSAPVPQQQKPTQQQPPAAQHDFFGGGLSTPSQPPQQQQQQAQHDFFGGGLSTPSHPPQQQQQQPPAAQHDFFGGGLSTPSQPQQQQQPTAQHDFFGGGLGAPSQPQQTSSQHDAFGGFNSAPPQKPQQQQPPQQQQQPPQQHQDFFGGGGFGGSAPHSQPTQPQKQQPPQQQDFFGGGGGGFGASSPQQPQQQFSQQPQQFSQQQTHQQQHQQQQQQQQQQQNPFGQPPASAFSPYQQQNPFGGAPQQPTQAAGGADPFNPFAF